MSPAAPQPLNFQPYGPNYSPILMLPLDGYRYHLVTPTGTSGTAIAVPPGARSVRVLSLGQDVWLRSSTAGTNTVTVAAPGGAVTDGTAPAQVGAGAADSFLLPDKCTFVALQSAGNVLVDWFA